MSPDAAICRWCDSRLFVTDTGEVCETCRRAEACDADGLDVIAEGEPLPAWATALIVVATAIILAIAFYAAVVAFTSDQDSVATR